jgi:hypothetical protein
MSRELLFDRTLLGVRVVAHYSDKNNRQEPCAGIWLSAKSLSLDLGGLGHYVWLIVQPVNGPSLGLPGDTE